MEHIQSSLTSQAFSMFKFHYVQMELSQIFHLSSILKLFKFHYVQMELNYAENWRRFRLDV